MRLPWWLVALLLALLTRWLYVAEVGDYVGRSEASSGSVSLQGFFGAAQVEKDVAQHDAGLVATRT